MKNIKEKVLQIVIEELGSGNDVKLETIVLNASGIDENVSREIIMRIEDELSVEISDEDALKLTTVKDIVEYIEKKKITVEPKTEKTQEK